MSITSSSATSGVPSFVVVVCSASGLCLFSSSVRSWSDLSMFSATSSLGRWAWESLGGLSSLLSVFIVFEVFWVRFDCGIMERAHLVSKMASSRPLQFRSPVRYSESLSRWFPGRWFRFRQSLPFRWCSGSLFSLVFLFRGPGRCIFLVFFVTFLVAAGKHVRSRRDLAHFCEGQHSTFDDSRTRSYLPGAWEKFAGNVTISIINLRHMCAYSASLRLKIITNLLSRRSNSARYHVTFRQGWHWVR